MEPEIVFKKCETCGEIFFALNSYVEKRVNLGEAVKKMISRGRGGISFCGECGNPEFEAEISSEIHIEPGRIFIDGKEF